MNKEEAIEYYSKDMEEGFAPRYGDTKTTESIEKCYDQVMEKIESGIEEWDGCTGKALCCKQFTHKFDLMETAKKDPFLGAHFKGDEGDFPITLNIKHRCNMLDECDKCGIYDSRPKTCRDYLCQASKLRRDMFWKIKYPQIVRMVDSNEIDKEEGSRPKGASNEREDAQDHG